MVNFEQSAYIALPSSHGLPPYVALFFTWLPVFGVCGHQKNRAEPAATRPFLESIDCMIGIPEARQDIG